MDSTVVRRGHRAVIDAVAQRWATELSADPNLGIRVIGYASVTGGVALNEDLAQRRAEAVRDHLVDLGVPEDQILIDSSGSRLPMDQGDSPQSLARNPRVEISKFVAATLAGSQAELDPTLDAQVTALKATVTASVEDQLRDGHIVFTLRPTVVQAPFSGTPGGIFTTVKPSPTPQDLLFTSGPHVAFPTRIDVPGQGPTVFTGAKWKMTLSVVLVARKGGLIVPLDARVDWDLDVSIRMIVGPDPKGLSRSLTTVVAVNSQTATGFLANGPIPDLGSPL